MGALSDMNQCTYLLIAIGPGCLQISMVLHYRIVMVIHWLTPLGRSMLALLALCTLLVKILMATWSAIISLLLTSS